jgi:hypothetical protein
MVWLDKNYNYPKYEMARWQKPYLRDTPRMEWERESKVATDRRNRQQFSGEMGFWFRQRYRKRQHLKPINRRR